jgi:hypothetical protein
MYKILHIPTGDFVYRLESEYNCVGRPSNDAYRIINIPHIGLAERYLQDIMNFGIFISYDNYINYNIIKAYKNEFEIVETKE